MKKIIILVLVIVLATPIITFAQVGVRGYWRDSDGDGYKDTYVWPHQRTAPDNNPYNNYTPPPKSYGSDLSTPGLPSGSQTWGDSYGYGSGKKWR